MIFFVSRAYVPRPAPPPNYSTQPNKRNKKQCSCNIVDSKAGEKLSFCVDGPSLHLVMDASNEGREGIGFRVVDVPADKRPNEENPYRSVAHVLCGNIRQRTGQQCKKKVRACLLDMRSVFFCVFCQRPAVKQHRMYPSPICERIVVPGGLHCATVPLQTH